MIMCKTTSTATLTITIVPYDLKKEGRGKSHTHKRHAPSTRSSSHALSALTFRSSARHRGGAYDVDVSCTMTMLCYVRIPGTLEEKNTEVRVFFVRSIDSADRTEAYNEGAGAWFLFWGFFF